MRVWNRFCFKVWYAFFIKIFSQRQKTSSELPQRRIYSKSFIYIIRKRFWCAGNSARYRPQRQKEAAFPKLWWWESQKGQYFKIWYLGGVSAPVCEIAHRTWFWKCRTPDDWKDWSRYSRPGWRWRVRPFPSERPVLPSSLPASALVSGGPAGMGPQLS